MSYDVPTTVDNRESELKHEKLWGKYNDAPPNFEEITVEDFAKSMFFTYTPKKIEFRQVLNYKGGHFLNLHMFFFHDNTGIAMHNEFWEGTVTYFKFALCEHEFFELSQMECSKKNIKHHGMCWHVYECTKCGYRESQDSSD